MTSEPEYSNDEDRGSKSSGSYNGDSGRLRAKLLKEKPEQLIEELRDAPKMKKNLEQDSQLLQNRIRHLQQELEKTKRKVHETESRAEEIRTMKQKNAERKEVRKRTTASMSGLSQQRTQELRRQQAEAREKLLRARQEKEELARREADRLRIKRLKAKRENEEIKAREIDETKRRVQDRKQEVERRKREEDRMRRLAERESLREARKQLEHEREENAELQQLIETLESKEAKWIDRLRSALDEQRQVYQELEHELAQDAAEKDEARSTAESKLQLS